MRRSLFAAAAMSFLAAAAVDSQISTGSISGRVEDPGGLAVPDASVTVRHLATGRERITRTSVSGDFTFTGLDGGEYRMTVEKQGLKQAERGDLVLPAGMRLPAGTIALEIGQLAESATLTAERGAIVRTVSAERSGVITSTATLRRGRPSPVAVAGRVASPAGFDPCIGPPSAPSAGTGELETVVCVSPSKTVPGGALKPPGVVHSYPAANIETARTCSALAVSPLPGSPSASAPVAGRTSGSNQRSPRKVPGS